MIYKVYTIFDRVSGQFGNMFYQNNEAEAVRKFNYVAAQSPMVAADLALYYVGEIDVSSGTLTDLCQPFKFVTNPVTEVSKNEK